MRDPEGSLELRERHVARSVRPDSPSARFLATDAARSLVASGHLIDYERAGDDSLVSPRLPFASHPYEWSDAQFARAAALTVDIARAVLPARHELKDASAWNVVFHGTRPVFCDLLSFEPIAAREWWAFGQFVRHFVLPLGVSRLNGIRAHHAFQLSRDGLDPGIARRIMGPRRFLSRYWPLVVDYRAGRAPAKPATASDPARFRERIYDYCARSTQVSSAARGSHWSRYAAERSHYSPEASESKQATVERWLGQVRPSWVTDLGCNTGEYSRLAQRCGASVVVAVDYDHDCIEQLYEANAGTVIHPVIANLGDLPGGRGWMGTEAPGLVERLERRAEVVICLALIHHLAISESIPLREIARLIARLCRECAIVELIGETDPMVTLLAAQRRRAPAEFTLALQRSALGEFFTIEAEAPVRGAERTLALLRLRSGRETRADA